LILDDVMYCGLLIATKGVFEAISRFWLRLYCRMKLATCLVWFIESCCGAGGDSAKIYFFGEIS